MDPDKRAFLFGELPAGMDPEDPAHRAMLLDAVGRDGDLDRESYLASSSTSPRCTAPPTLVSAEGDPLVECHAVVDVPAADNAAAALGRLYTADGEGFVWSQPLPDGANRHWTTSSLHSEKHCRGAA